MKKIMFNDQYGLTQAVLDGRKTQTRRILGYENYTQRYIDKIAVLDAKYNVGEVVAVAQSYRECGGFENGIPLWDIIADKVGRTNAGWGNKMFVRPELMPHQIKITNIKIERLQDISDEDCLREGIYLCYYEYADTIKEKKECVFSADGYGFNGIGCHYPTPKEAFASLIDKVSGRGTWNSNPYVFVYEFELVK